MIKNTVPVMYRDLSARQIISIVNILEQNKICTKYTWNNKMHNPEDNYEAFPVIHKNSYATFIKSHPIETDCRYSLHHWSGQDVSTSIVKIRDGKTEIFRTYYGYWKNNSDENKRMTLARDEYKKKFARWKKRQASTKNTRKISNINIIYLSENFLSGIIEYRSEDYTKNILITNIAEIT